MVLICQSGMHLMHRHGIHGGHFVLLFPLHPPILEPDFDLSLCQTQGMCDFDPPTACQVAIKMKFFLQFESLVSSVGRPLSLRLTVLIYRVLTEMCPLHPGVDLRGIPS